MLQVGHASLMVSLKLPAQGSIPLTGACKGVLSVACSVCKAMS